MIQPSSDAITLVLVHEEETHESFYEFRHDDDGGGNVHIAGASPRVPHHQHQRRILKAQNQTGEILVARPYLGMKRTEGRGKRLIL